MGAFAAGAVVLVPFPFSDLSRSKLRPAVALAGISRDDWVLCQVTSNPFGDERAITLTDDSFAEGSLEVVSYARPGKLFTANTGLISEQAGILKAEAFNLLIDAVVRLLNDHRPVTDSDAERVESRPPN